MERARHLLTAKLWPAESERSSKIAAAGRWKAWLLGGLLIAVALWLVYLAVAGML